MSASSGKPGKNGSLLRAGLPPEWRPHLRTGYHYVMQIVVQYPESRTPVRMLSEEGMTDDEFYDFCQANPDLRIERSARGEITIMPGTGGETGYRNADLTSQLVVWAKADGRGVAFDSSTEFRLPSGAVRMA